MAGSPTSYKIPVNFDLLSRYVSQERERDYPWYFARRQSFEAEYALPHNILLSEIYKGERRCAYFCRARLGGLARDKTPLESMQRHVAEEARSMDTWKDSDFTNTISYPPLPSSPSSSRPASPHPSDTDSDRDSLDESIPDTTARTNPNTDFNHPPAMAAGTTDFMGWTGSWLLEMVLRFCAFLWASLCRMVRHASYFFNTYGMIFLCLMALLPVIIISLMAVLDQLRGIPHIAISETV